MSNRKRALVEAIVSKLKQELEIILESARAAHLAATHEESKAEDAHDTRGLEASYLAGAQAARAESLKRIISGFQFFHPRDFAEDEAIAVGALVELETSGSGGARKSICFLVIEGGGISVNEAGRAIQVVNVQSPLGQELIGKCAGDSVETEAAGATREYEILSVR